MRTLVLFGLIVLVAVSIGCRRHYQDAELVGSWQIVDRRVNLNDQRAWQADTNPVAQRYAFSPDHTFTSQFVGAKDMRHFGVWALESDRLAITVLSNSFSPAITSNRESVRIVRLTESVITLESRDQRDKLQQRTFTRTK